MLKRLELVGFKSFADRTVFDFSPGLTAIVGPNGSGKSNVVDAVRWILGEQSAKSLRGGEMADVIFNGSTSRRGLGLAEVSITLDNSKQKFNLDAEEIQVTRRVYRSSEGEYLINQQPCRLKDIKDLFLGTGAGSTHYCIIEQGRVDVLLQASTKDRRVIFEEAAGISRFKARKTETIRKLERVDQNLLQLQLLLDEVNKQLRSVKLQASKAERWKEHSKRLQELRVSLGLQEYHKISGQLQAETELLDRLRSDLARRWTDVQGWEAELRRFDESLERIERECHEQEARVGQARTRIMAAETTLGHERESAEQLEKDLAARRLALMELNARTAILTAAAGQASLECSGVDADCQRQRQRVHGMDEAMQNTIARIGLLKRQIDADKIEHLEAVRRATQLQNEARSQRTYLDTLAGERQKLQLRGDQAAEHLAHIDVELQALIATENQLSRRLGQARQSLGGSGQQRDRFRQLIDAASAQIADLRARRSGLASRIEVLDGLERTHEGLGSGVHEVFSLLEQPDPGPWRTVLGMVADFLTVPREFAPLIDLALGELAQRFLVRDAALLDEAIRSRAAPFSSRVTFLPIQPPARSLVRAKADGLVVAAVDVVTCGHPELADLPARLLGTTLIVPDLAAARNLAAAHPGMRFITRHGELVEADGTLTVGSPLGGTALLSRKSELRELRQQAEDLDQRIAVTEHDLAGLRHHQNVLENQVVELQEEITVLNDEIAGLRSRIGQHQERRDGLHQEVELNRSDVSRLEQEIADRTEACRLAAAAADQAEHHVQTVQSRLEQAEREMRDRELQREQQQAERETARVALAKVEEQLKALRARHSQLAGELDERRRDRDSCDRELAAIRNRRQESQRAMLQAQGELAQGYLDKESAQQQVSRLQDERDQQRRQRDSLAGRVHAVRSSWHDEQQQAHQIELKANNLANQRSHLVQRLHDDYQLDLASLYEEQRKAGDWQPPDLNPEAAGEEIEELRRKIHRLGSVNLEALDEMLQMESRARELQTQFDDLTGSQKSLLEIINQINQDSRKLFQETFAAIRGHFQELFRKLFGGGMADVVLEDETDILECGIEIVARPPGKELRSISLMSGGEKTMTAVALLLAIFRSKPSPFCILDEVDAALDEANIGRFTAVLREFLDLSQFIIITHSKKTMASADVLYGVTMQESGISKRVAVRFEDWPDESKNGETGNGRQTNGETGNGDSKSARHAAAGER